MREPHVDQAPEGAPHLTAVVRGESRSRSTRHAVAQRAEATLADRERGGHLDDVLGVVRGGGGDAERTGEAFTEHLVERSRGR